MNKEDLIAMGLTEEQAKKVMDSLDGSYVKKTRFNKINKESKTLKKSLSDRDKQLENLKKPTAIMPRYSSRLPICRSRMSNSRRHMMKSWQS